MLTTIIILRKYKGGVTVTVKRLKELLEDIDENLNVYVGCKGNTNCDVPKTQYRIEAAVVENDYGEQGILISDGMAIYEGK